MVIIPLNFAWKSFSEKSPYGRQVYTQCFTMGNPLLEVAQGNGKLV